MRARSSRWVRSSSALTARGDICCLIGETAARGRIRSRRRSAIRRRRRVRPSPGIAFADPPLARPSRCSGPRPKEAPSSFGEESSGSSAAASTEATAEVRVLCAAGLDRRLNLGVFRIDVRATEDPAAARPAAVGIGISNVEALLTKTRRKGDLRVLSLGPLLVRQLRTCALDEGPAGLERGLNLRVISIDALEEATGAATRRGVGIGDVEPLVPEALGEDEKDVLWGNLLRRLCACGILAGVGRGLLALGGRGTWSFCSGGCEIVALDDAGCRVGGAR